MNRRSFMQGILAAAAAPALVRYGSLMVSRPLARSSLSAILIEGMLWEDLLEHREHTFNLATFTYSARGTVKCTQRFDRLLSMSELTLSRHAVVRAGGVTLPDTDWSLKDGVLTISTSLKDFGNIMPRLVTVEDA